MRTTTHPEKARRREAAAERQAARDERSVEDQVRLIIERPGDSMKEFARITGQTLRHDHPTPGDTDIPLMPKQWLKEHG